MSKNSELQKTLSLLMDQHGLSENELARRTSFSQSTINRVLNGTSKSYRLDTLNTLAKYFGISIGQLIGNEPLEGGSIDKQTATRFAPVLEWDNAKEVCLSEAEFPATKAKKPLISDTGPRSFWLQMKGSAMHPFLSDKTSYFCVDPDRKPKDADLVLVHQKDADQLMVRMLRTDGPLKVICTVNPDYPFQSNVDDNYQICGVVTEDHTDYSLRN